MSRKLKVWLLLAPILSGCPEDGELEEVEMTTEAWDCRIELSELQQCKEVSGIARAIDPGTRAGGALSIAIRPELASDLSQLNLKLVVRSGQSLPGEPVTLRLDEQIVGDASFGGPLGNEARFQLDLARPRCAPERCTLTFVIAPTLTASPLRVPIELSGEVVIESRRRAPSWSDFELQVHDVY